MHGVKVKLKKLFLKATGKVKHFKITKRCKHLWYGGKYAGFYVCPDLLDEKSIVYSFGIGEDVSFDNTVIKKHACHVFGFDPTPKSIDWIYSQKTNKKFHFYKFGISDKSGFVDFFLPKNPEYVSGSLLDTTNVDTNRKVRVVMKSLEDIMNELNHKHIDVLKMDIEGAEYDVIDNILRSKVSITQILIEFHDRFFENGALRTKQAIQKLNSHGYAIFAVSDSFEEISFIRKNAI
ncbi:methyltransferase, FkbM family [Saccharicrinis carchari]|uniref:Methyltransferase, FkbM family n=1 Tax=Saccharicrinis carchari TaxID=1168039 RepID=A0A521EAD3_SACCC|nr:methyltransferase, FkbM family [Saccharicrinis carchari]